MSGGQGRLPSRSNCKGPTRAAVCSHSGTDVAAGIPPTARIDRNGRGRISMEACSDNSVTP